MIMFDEPSLGVQPNIVARIFENIQQINQQGITVLLVEQNVKRALDLADRAYVLQTGNIVLEGTGTELMKSEMVQKAYLGI
jgi:branched-chain amino acid transport system ATP-binding protein